ncbi:MAG: shikimate kinase [Mycobacteriales bacterium]
MIVLIGFMGAGKTTIGQLMAARLELPFLDSDEAIERRAGRTIRDIFDQDGEPAFRKIEHDTVRALLRGPDAVLALGGGAAEHPATQRELALVPVIHLKVEYDGALTRIAGDPSRPLLARPDLAEVYARRLPIYESLATVTVPTDGRRPEAVARQALRALRLATIARTKGSHP